MYDFKTELTNHATGGGTLSKAVTAYIEQYCKDAHGVEHWEEACAKAICEMMAEWRNEVADAVKDGRLDAKAVNNSSNYVGTICRKQLGYTIKVVKRKPEYVYDYSAIAQVKETEDAAESTESDTGEVPIEEPQAELTTRYLLERIIDERGFDDVAEAFRELLTERKEQDDE